MPSRVEISNLALAACGCTDTIADPSDPTKAAREVARAWDETRLAVLRSGKWNFAKKRGALPALAGISADEIFPYTAAFKLSPEVLRLCDMLDDHVSADYVLERGMILANVAGPLRVSFIIDVPNTGLWDASFVEAFAQYLGFKIADNLTGDRARKLDCWNAFKALVEDAKAIDALENPPEAQEESDWILARLRG